MGLDWERKCAPTWKRTWDRGLQHLSEPNLFNQATPDVERTFRVRPIGQHEFRAGAVCMLRWCGDALLLVEGVTPVGEAVAVPASILERIRSSGGGMAFGTIQLVYPETKAAEISVA